jgi:hypothetical protein
LTEYEAGQVAEIAAWKSEVPSRITWTLEHVREPLGRILSKALPCSKLSSLFAKAETLIGPDDGLADLARQAGTSAVEELRHRPLEECDRLAMAVSVRAQRQTMLQGAALGLGGPAIDLLFIAVLMAAAVRAVRRIGHCYGYRLDSELDREYVLGILELATIDDPAERQRIRERLRRLIHRADTSEPPIGLEGVKKALAKDFALKSVPVVGDVAAFGLDYSFLRRAGVAARRVFQERWLRHHGKISEISPASSSRRTQTLHVAGEVTGSLAYMGTYAMGFVAALPVAAAWRLASRLHNPAAVVAQPPSPRPVMPAWGDRQHSGLCQEFRGHITVIYAPAPTRVE